MNELLDDEPAIALRGVRRGFANWIGLRKREVLTGVDLELARGRTLGLAGPNGSGKSTLLRLIAGIDRADTGVVRVLGGDPARAGIRRQVGYLPEDSPFPPELGARAALALLGSLQGVPRAQLNSECDRLLALVGLADHAHQRLGRFSRGMLRRFGLAQAWLHRPAVVLLDEPTAGLDAQGFEVLGALLDEARARRATVVLASHLIADLERHCDELAILLDGRITLRGDPRAILAERTLLDLYREHSNAIPTRR